MGMRKKTFHRRINKNKDEEEEGHKVKEKYRIYSITCCIEKESFLHVQIARERESKKDKIDEGRKRLKKATQSLPCTHSNSSNSNTQCHEFFI